MGYLNASPDDDYNAQTMAEGGAVTTQLPGASGLDGMLTVVPKALTAAVGAVGGLAEDVMGGVAATNSGAYRADLYGGANILGPLPGGTPGADTHAPTQASMLDLVQNADAQMRASANAATAVMSKWAATGEDPRVTGTLGRTVFGPVKALGIVAGSAPVIGPWGAAALYGSTEAHDSYQQDIAAGIDPTTAAEKAGVAGVTAGAFAALPVVGTTLIGKVLSGMVLNQALDVGGRTATWAILKANGYDAQADQQKIFDRESLLSDILMGAAFGVHSHLTEGAAIRPSEVNPADVDTAAAVLVQNQLDRSAPGIPVGPAAANTHVRVMTDALDSLANGDEPNVSAADAQTLAEGTLPDPSHDTAAMITDAAHAELPGFTDAVAPITDIEPPPRVAGEPLGPIPPDAQGNPSPVQFDAPTQYRIGRLTSQFGDTLIPDPDSPHGNVISVNEMVQRMQQQLAEADAMGRAHEMAAACFIATGSAS